MIFLFLPLLFSVVYPRVSKIISGSITNSRPAQVYVPGVDLIYDGNTLDWDYIVWDDGSIIAWES